MSIYDFEVKDSKGENVSLSKYKDLQALYEEYKEEGLVILGFPCNQFMNQEPGSNEEIQSFCELNFGVAFPVFGKIDVNGDKADPLFKYLSSEAPGIMGLKSIKWNFTKFIIDKNGEVIERFAPQTNPQEMRSIIEKLLKA